MYEKVFYAKHKGTKTNAIEEEILKLHKQLICIELEG